MRALLLKAHVKGHTRKDGTVVKDYDTKVQKKVVAAIPKKSNWPSIYGFGGAAVASAPVAAKPQAKSQPSLFSGEKAKPSHPGLFSGGSWGGKPKDSFMPKPEPKGYHPQLDDHGKKVGIYNPHEASAPEGWLDGNSVITVTPGGFVPAALNGIPFAPWADAPRNERDWEDVPGQVDDLDEPPLNVPIGKQPATGVVVMEPDGRVWIVCPSNSFGGYKNTFAKGKYDNDEMSFQANAIKEAYEESGLQVEIDSFLGDVERTTSVARYYLARRVGGTPAAMGWESQAVQLVPASQLVDHMAAKVDKEVAGWVAALSTPK